MTKRRRQNNGKIYSKSMDERVERPGSDVGAGVDVSDVPDAGKPVAQDAGENSSSDDTAAEIKSGLVAADGINQSDQGSVSDVGRKELSQVGTGESAAEKLERAADTGGETAKADLGVTISDAGTGSEKDSSQSASDTGASSSSDIGQPASDTGENPRTDGASADSDSTATPDLNAEIEKPTCFICEEVLQPGDLCATEVNEGTVHAACLEGSPVVSLHNGEPTDGAFHTFLYVEEMIQDLRTVPGVKAALQSEYGDDLRTIFNLASIGAGLQHAVRVVKEQDGPFKDWEPVVSEAEIVGDLHAALLFEQEKKNENQQPTKPRFAEDTDPREISHFVAYNVFCGVHGSVDLVGAIINAGEPSAGPVIPFDAVSELVELVRKIGTRATPEVLAQQLVIGKHRQSAELTSAEVIALKAFAAILVDLDEFAASEKQRVEADAAEKPKPTPVPIDETTMETVDGPMATW